MIKSQKYEPRETLCAWHHVAITLAVRDNKHGAFSTLRPPRLGRWHAQYPDGILAELLQFNHLLLNFPHRMRQGGKKTLRGIWDRSLRKSVAPTKQRCWAPGTLKRPRSEFVSAMWENRPRLRSSQWPVNIPHQAAHVIGAVQLRRSSFPTFRTYDLPRHCDLKLPGNSGKKRKQCGWSRRWGCERWGHLFFATFTLL